MCYLLSPRGKLVTDLLTILMCQPELPYRPLTLSKHWSYPMAGSKGAEKQKNLDEEVRSGEGSTHRE